MDTRKEDFKLIEQGLKSRNDNDRRQAFIAKERILSESASTKKAREELVDAHRSGNRGKMEELHHRLEVENKRVKEQIERYYSGRRGF